MSVNEPTGDTVEINKIKIVKKVWKKNIFPKKLLWTWIILSLILFLTRLLAIICGQCSGFIKIQPLQFSSFIFPGVTGLSFSITLLNATRNLYKTSDLVAMFNYVSDENKDKDNTEKGDLFYRTLAPYITASFLWLVISILAFISSLIDINIDVYLKEVLFGIFASLVIAGLLNLWFLIGTHLSDIAAKVEIELSEKEN